MEKKRLTVNINEEQYQALLVFAEMYEWSVAEVLGNYIADLTGVHSNGSDERQMAADYFSRTHLAYQW